MTDAFAKPATDAIILGQITGLFGVKGGLKVFSYTDPREAILNYSQWWLKRDGDWQATELTEGKRHGKSVIAYLQGINDRDEASKLLGCNIGVPRENLPKLEQGSYYWSDLEGMKVMHRDGSEIGTVAYVMETGANDVLVTAGDKERLIPFIADKVILDVDLAEGVIKVDWEWE